MKRKRFLIFTMLFVVLVTAIAYIKQMPGSASLPTFKEGITYHDANNNGKIDCLRTDPTHCDWVDIHGEEFWVMFKQGEQVYLFAKNNLDISDEDNIKQKSSLTGNINSASTIEFALDPTGSYSTDTYIYRVTGKKDMSYYFNKYMNGLSTAIDPNGTVRMSIEPVQKFDFTNFWCFRQDDGNCIEQDAPDWMFDTNYWTGIAVGQHPNQVYAVLDPHAHTFAELANYDYNTKIGIRPIIIVRLADLTQNSIRVIFHNNPRNGKPASFNTTEPATQYHIDNDLVDPVADASADGYIFKGWYVQDVGGSKWNFDSPLVASELNEDPDGVLTLHLYAHWVEQINITYVPGNCGTMATTVQTVGLGSTIEQPLPMTEAQNMIFQGWYYYDSDLGETLIWTFGPDGSNADIVYGPTTLTARCEERTEVVHRVDFDMQGHGLDDQPDPQTQIPDGGFATRPTPDPTEDGWHFDGWFTTNECETQFPFETLPIYEDKIVYACWSEEVTLDFDMQGHGLDDQPDPQTMPVGDYPEKPTPDPDDPDYDFLGWYTDGTCTTEFNFMLPLTQDKTAYACWEGAEEIKWRVDFVMNNPEPTPVPPQTDIPNGGQATKPANPMATCYIFKGWYLDDGTFQNEYVFGTPVTSNVVLYAKWEQITYTATFVMHGHGTQVQPQTVTCGNPVVRPNPDPEEDGWEFQDWYNEAGHRTLYDFTKIIEEDVVIHAYWIEEEEPIEVTFDIHGHGDQPDPQEIPSGDHPTNPGDLEEECWDFGGWYTDATYATEFDFTEALYQDTVVHAKWTKKNVTVTFVRNGHGQQPNPQTIECGEKAMQPMMLEECWIFKGWYLDDQTFTQPFDFNQPVKEDKVLYAKWEQIKYTLTFDLNGYGDPTATRFQPTEYACGEPTVRPNPDPTDPEKVFDDWYEDDDTFEDEFPWGEPLEEDTEVHANWNDPQPDDHTVTFDNHDHGDEPGPQTVPDGGTPRNPGDLTEECWEFGGWYTDATYTTEFDFSAPVYEDKVVHAKWTQKEFTVTFIKNGHGADVAAQTVKCGEKATEVILEEDCWIFGGWFLDNETFAQPYDFDAAVKENKTLYAKWTQKEYTITFVKNGHGADVDPVTVKCGEVVTEPELTEKCWVFGGWFLDNETFQNEFDFTAPVTDNHTLYAKWEIKTVVVTFDMQGHAVDQKPAAQTITCGEKPVRPTTDPEEPGYKFNDWIVDPTGDTAFPFDEPVEEDTVVYADWDKKTIIVQFDINGHGDENPDDEELDPNSLVPEPVNPKDDEWVFEGWYLDPELTIKWDFDTDNATEDIILYAKWTRVDSPQTFDSIVLYVSLGIMSATGLAGVVYFKKKHNM